MFEKVKAKRIVANTLNDVKLFINELPKYDVFLAGGIDDLLISSLFIAFLDYYAYINKRSNFGDLIVNSFLERVEFVDLYRGLIVDTHKEYHQIVKECVQLDNSANGLYRGYLKISRYIGKSF